MMREGTIKTIRAKLLAILLSIAIALTFAFSLGVQQVNAATGYSNEYPYLLNVDHSKVYNISIFVTPDYEGYYDGYGGINCLYEIKVFSGSYTHYSDYDDIPRAAFTEITLDCDVNSPGFVLEDGTKVDAHTIKTNRDGMIRFKLPSYDYELSGDEYYNYPTNVYAPEVTVGLRGGDYTYLVGGRGYPARYGTSGPYVSLTKDAEKDDRNSWTKNWSRPLANYDPEEQELLKEIFEGYAKDLSAAVETETVPSKLPHGHDYFFKDPDIWKIPTSDQKRANEVTVMVNALPAVNELTLNDKSAVQAAKDAYDALTDKQKGFVEDATKTKLDDAVAKIAELKEEKTDQEAADAVKDLIEALPDPGDVKASNKDQIKAARDAFENLTRDQKKYIDAPTLQKLIDDENALKALMDDVKVEPKEANSDQMGTDGSPVGPGASAATADKAITTGNLDTDPAGSGFAPLMLKSSKQGKKNIKLAWASANDTTSYVVYGNLCGSQYKMVKLAVLNGGATSYNVKDISNIKVKKGKYYKFIVVALNKDNKVVSTSKVVHVATKGGKVTNYKKVTVKVKKGKKWKNAKNVAVKEGATMKLKVKLTKQSKKGKVKKHAKVRYESSNTKVATVTPSGTIMAKAKGTCTVYAYAQNGVCKALNVNVK